MSDMTANQTWRNPPDYRRLQQEWAAATRAAPVVEKARIVNAEFADSTWHPDPPKETNFDPQSELVESQLEIVSTLLRHQGQLPRNTEDALRAIEDPNTAADLREALKALLTDAALLYRLDGARPPEVKRFLGIPIGTKGGVDGKWNADDLLVLSNRPEMIAFNQRRAELFVNNYVPSESNNGIDASAEPNSGTAPEEPTSGSAPAEPTSGSAPAEPASGNVQLARRMLLNDALRELYLYSDSLHKKVGLEDMQSIVDGTFEGGKLPPQVIAAAKYFVDHADQWRQVMGGDKVNRSQMCDAISRNVNLSASANEAIQGLSRDREFFFGDGALTREKLEAMRGDESLSAERRKTVETLLRDSVLFGMLDNAKHGHAAGGFFSKRKADDGKIGAADVDALLGKLTAANRTAPAEPPPRASPSAADQRALAAMRAGAEDDPEVKKVKGGGGFFKVLGNVMDVMAKVYDAASIVMGALAKVPGLGPLFAAASVATGALAGGMRLGKALMDGAASLKEALINFAMDIGTAVVGALTLPGMGKMLGIAAKEGAQAGLAAGLKAGTKEAASETVGTAAREGVQAGAAAGVKAGAKEGASEAAEAGARTAARSAAGEGAQTAAEQAARAAARAELRQQAKQAIKAEVRAQLQSMLEDQLQKQCERLGIPTPWQLRQQMRDMVEQMAIDFVVQQAAKRGIPVTAEQLVAELPPQMQAALKSKAAQIAMEFAKDPRAAAERVATDMARDAFVRMAPPEVKDFVASDQGRLAMAVLLDPKNQSRELAGDFLKTEAANHMPPGVKTFLASEEGRMALVAARLVRSEAARDALELAREPDADDALDLLQRHRGAGLNEIAV